MSTPGEPSRTSRGSGRPEGATDGRRGPGRRAFGLRTLVLAGMIDTARELGAVDIAVGGPPGQPPPEAVAAAAEAMWAGRNQYTDPAGLPALRAVIAARVGAALGRPVSPGSEVTVTAGSTEGVLVSLLTVTDPGAEVILPEPAFETYAGAVELAGCTPVRVPLAGPGWALDTERIAAALTARTAAVLVNSPHNPTGRVFTREETRALLELCERHDVLCVADEVYADFVYDGRSHVSALAFEEFAHRVIAVGSLSKSNEMAGWRIGYCVAAPHLTAVLRKVHERTSFSTATPLQYGAAVLPGPSRGTSRFERQRDEMVRRLSDMGFDVRPPEGGWFVLAGTARLGLRSGSLADALLRRAKVLVAPGAPFFHTPGAGEGWVRATFVKDPAAQAAALDAMEHFLGALPARGAR